MSSVAGLVYARTIASNSCPQCLHFISMSQILTLATLWPQRGHASQVFRLECPSILTPSDTDRPLADSNTIVQFRPHQCLYICEAPIGLEINGGVENVRPSELTERTKIIKVSESSRVTIAVSVKAVDTEQTAGDKRKALRLFCRAMIRLYLQDNAKDRNGKSMGIL